MIPEPGDANRDITITETFHLQTDDELSDKELKQIKADDQAIQTILLGLPEDIYAAVDSCETAQEIWLRAMLFNEWERFTSNEGDSIESYYHRFLKLMNDLKRNKHFPEKTATRAEGNAAGQNGNQIRCYNYRGVGHYARNCTVRPRRRDAAYLQTQLLMAQKEKAGIQLQAEEYDIMVAVAELDEIEEVNANCILMANLQQASTSDTQTDSAPVYDTDGSAEVHESYDDNEIFNMFTQEEQYTELLEPIPESHQVPQNDNDVISGDTNVEQGGETVEQHPANFEETRALYESLYQNLATEVEKVNSVNLKLKETSADLTTELARFKNQERCFEISQEKYDKLERLQNFEIQFLKEAAKFVGDFKSFANEADASLAKHKALEFEIERLLKAVVSQDIMIIVQTKSVVDTSDLQTELERTKERFENCIIKKETEYAKLWNDWYKKCDECKYDKISYDKAYKDIQQKIEWLQAQLGDLKGKSKDTSSVSDTQNPLSQKLENKNVELEFQELQSNIYKNAKLRTQLFKKVSDQKNNTHDTSKNTKFAKQPIVENLPKVGKPNALPNPVTSNSVSTPQESKECEWQKLLWKESKGKGFCQINPKEISAKGCNAKEGKLAASSNSKSQYNCSNGDNACTSNAMEPKIERFPNSTSLLDRNDHVAAILGFGDLQWGNFLITKEIVQQTFIQSMASASPICLMAHASSTKSWLWHQRLSHLNFNTINDLARNDLVAGLPKFKYHKEHLCPSCEQGKSKRASHPPKPVPNSRQRLHLLHMDLCGRMRIANINGKRYVLVIVDDYSHYTWVHFLRSKDEAPEVIIKFLKRITVLLQSPVIIIRTDNGTEFKNEAIATACFTQNRSIIHRRFNKTPYELINDRKPNISFLHVFDALCYPKNDREDIGKLGPKGDIGFFIGYSADSCAYRIYNRRTKKIIETMNVSFDELSAMAFEQRSSKPRLQSMTSGHISLGLDLTYASSTITTKQPSEGELDLLFEAMYDDYIGGQPSATARTDVDELNPNAMVDGNMFVNPFAKPSISAATASSSQQNVNPSNMHMFYQPYPYEFQWTKDHPLEQVIREPSRPVLTRTSDSSYQTYRISSRS
nr:hypothetical protein [Tanacetum cinerariifolium]